MSNKPTTAPPLPASKMQAILDKAEAEFDAGNGRESFMQLIEALKLLARGQQQVMSQVNHVQNQNPFIGGHE